MVSSESILTEILLAVGTSWDVGVVLPRYDALFEGFARVVLAPVEGPALVLCCLGDIIRRICQELGQSGQSFLEPGDFHLSGAELVPSDCLKVGHPITFKTVSVHVAFTTLVARLANSIP
jgi:hypothetical protein